MILLSSRLLHALLQAESIVNYSMLFWKPLLAYFYNLTHMPLFGYGNNAQFGLINK